VCSVVPGVNRGNKPESGWIHLIVGTHFVPFLVGLEQFIINIFKGRVELDPNPNLSFRTNNVNELSKTYVVFVSNRKQVVPLWRQQAGRDEEKLV